MKEAIETVLPAGSELKARLLRLAVLYDELASRQAALTAAVPFHCPPGCGVCSAKFEPDILPLEAAFLALFARRSGLGTDSLADQPAGRCPLYCPDDGRHCPVYPARPLVCRLFGFSALPDKSGVLIYTPCEHMTGPGRGPRPVASLGLPADSSPPSMTEYSLRLSLIAPGEEAMRQPLRQALPEAMRKLELLITLAAQVRTADDENDHR